METARLTSDGQLFDSDGSPASDPLPLLSLALLFEPGCTLRTFFAMLVRYPVLQKLSGFLPGAVREADTCPATGCVTDDIPLLVVGKTMELIGFPGKPRAELYLWLRGLKPQSPGADSAPDSQGASAKEPLPLSLLMEADAEIRFVPLQVLLDTPLVTAGLKHVVLGDTDRKLFCESRFTLFEVVDGLAWELGFHGGNQQCSLGR